MRNSRRVVQQSIAHGGGSREVVGRVFISVIARNKSGSRSQCWVQARPAEAWSFLVSSCAGCLQLTYSQDVKASPERPIALHMLHAIRSIRPSSAVVPFHEA